MRIFLVSSFAAYLFYALFYFYSPLIWSVYTQLPLQEFTTWSRWALIEAHDGVEVFVLYPLVFLIIAAACGVHALLLKARGWAFKLGSWVMIAAGALMYYRAVGFLPPVFDPRVDILGMVFIVSIVAVSVLLARYMGRSLVLKILAGVLLFCVCLVPTRWFIIGCDYLYIFTPALRTMHGIPLRETFFQYDYLISFVVMGWMQLKLPMSLFHLVGGLSFFVLIIGLYHLARKYFMHQWLALYLAVAVMVIRIYADATEPGIFPQAAPLRLDWWLLIAVLGWWKGFRHWTVGLCLGFLLIYHHAFGMIYALSYAFFVFILFVIEKVEKKISWREDLVKYVTGYGINFCFMAGAVLIYQCFYAPQGIQAAFMYQQYNIGFLPIARGSFFWYVPVMFSCCALVLWRNRKALSEKYFQMTVMLIVFAVGNSFYFFGRSHETNVIKISAILCFVLFALLDMLHAECQQSLTSKTKRWAVPVIVLALLIGVSYAYSGRAVDRIKAQVANLLHGPYEDHSAFPMNIPSVSAATQGSSKITFLSILNDFDHYYAMGITPPHYYSFTNAWLLKKEYIDFLNDQLSKGYFLVMPSVELRAFIEILKELKPHQAIRVPDYIIMKASDGEAR